MRVAKGQVTIVNLLVLVVTELFFVLMLPSLQTFLNASIASVEADPNDMTQILVVFMQLVPVVLQLVILLTAFHWATIRREGF